MILQCDQCNTKFRLDDSKLKPGGVKVRCSKCRHVFVAGAELKHEESEFDALLSGLGAPAAPKTPEAAPPAAAQQASAELAALEFEAEPKESQQKPAAVEDHDLDAFDFSPETPSEAAKAGDEVEEGRREEPAGGDLDFGDLSFEPSAAEEIATPPQTAGGTDFGEFEFPEEPVAPPKEAPAAEGLDFGDLSFEEKTTEKEVPAAAEAPDFGEFSFDEEPALEEEKAAPAAADAMDFGEFSFEESSAPTEEPAAPAAAETADYGDFSFEEESAPKEAKAEPAAADALDFGELSFEGEGAQEEKPAPAATDALDFGDFSFEEESAPQQEQPASSGAATSDFGELSFDEEPAAGTTPAGDVSEEVVDFTPPAHPQGKQAPAAAEPEDDFSFGEFSFSEQREPEPAPVAEAVPPAATASGAAVASGLSEAKPADTAATQAKPAEGGGKAGGKSALDFSFGDKEFAAAVPEEGPEEELPPLSISSRRKGRSILTVTVVAISVIAVLALSAAGLYLLQSGPAALAKLDKLGIGFVAQWFGMEAPEEGRITIRNPLAGFHKNQEAGELFVVTGEAVNSYRKARASVQVKVSLFDKGGKVLLQKTAYCGNRLSSEQLATLPMEKIESIMNNQFGDSLSNLGVKPGQAIGFVVAIANVPKEAADFGVEVVGSTVAAGQ